MPNNTPAVPRLLGAACGDAAGSVYEHRNIKTILPPEKLLSDRACFTDDTVMTAAVAQGMKKALIRLREQGRVRDFTPADEPILLEEIRAAVLFWGRRYPYAGYGRRFSAWLMQDDPQPYGSYGNGSAMRASYPGWAAATPADAEFLAACSAKITHDDPRGIRGAQAIAGSIFLLRQAMAEGCDEREAKRRVRTYVSGIYDMNFTLAGIRPDYSFHVSCQRSVPQAVEAFLEARSFGEAIALAISIGGDSDTIAAMAGSLAEVIWPIPADLAEKVLAKLTPELRSALEDAAAYLAECPKVIVGN